MSSSYGNTWQLDHNFSNLTFSSGVWEWGPYENLTSTADFTYQEFESGIS
jgi:hypothetical protein